MEKCLPATRGSHRLCRRAGNGSSNSRAHERRCPHRRSNGAKDYLCKSRGKHFLTPSTGDVVDAAAVVVVASAAVSCTQTLFLEKTISPPRPKKTLFVPTNLHNLHTNKQSRFYLVAAQLHHALFERDRQMVKTTFALFRSRSRYVQVEGSKARAPRLRSMMAKGVARRTLSDSFAEAARKNLKL